MQDIKTNELRAQLKQTFIEWCKDSKCHGVLNIAKTQNKILKSIWIVSFLACSAACIYLISEALVSYLNNPISTKIEVIDDAPSIFPTISICMLNPLDSDNELVKSKVDRIIDSLAVSLETNHLAVYQTAATLQINDFLSNLNRSEQLFYGNTIDKSMYYCKFNTRVCFSDVFEWYFDFYLGNCYKFNPNGTLKVGKSGIIPGLQLQFVIPDTYSSFFNYGMRILIHNSSLTNPFVYDNGISLSPGFSYDIKVSRTYYNRLDAPYSNCQKDLTRNNPKKTFFMEIMFNELNVSTYDQKYCQNLIFQWILQTNCSCVNPAYPYYDFSIPKCLNTTQIRCQNSMFEEAYNNPDLYFGADCPKECDYFDYNVEMSQAAFPTEWLFENLTRWKFLPDAVRSRVARIDSYEESRKHFIAFNIYYDQLVYQLIKEEPFWNAVLLLSNFGGSLGLFVGMSILTFVELIELAFQFVQFTVLDRLNPRKIKAQANKTSENTQSELPDIL